MPQYSVPQFVEVEDKIIGPLTLKQFFILLGGAGIILLFYRTISNIFFFILLALPIGGAALILTFGRFNGRSITSLAGSLVQFFTNPRSFIFHRNVQLSSIQQKSEPKLEIAKATQVTPAERLSRLRKLTYILDQDLKAEQELIKGKFTNLK